jgi:hypothetical protein
MSICQAEKGFSLDELVKKVADAYEKKAFAEILKMNLLLTQEVLMHRIFNGKSNLQCCSDGHLTLNGSFERRIRTSLGEFKMVFWRVRCSKCGKTFAPLAKFIRLERYIKELKTLCNIIHTKSLHALRVSLSGTV